MHVDNRFPDAVISHPKLALQGEAWEEGGWQFPLFDVSIVNNNPRVRCWLNDPSEREKVADDGKPLSSKPILGRLDMIIFRTFVNLLKQCALSPDTVPNEGYQFDLVGPVYVDGKATDRLETKAKLMGGRDAEGMMFISIAAQNRKTPKFTFRTNRWYRVNTFQGEADKAVVSGAICVAWCDNIIDMLAQSLGKHYDNTLNPEYIRREERRKQRERDNATSSNLSGGEMEMWVDPIGAFLPTFF